MSPPRGVILAGGRGSRLHPLTAIVNKHLLPVHDKPMVYYPLTTLMFAGVREVVIVTTPDALPSFERLLGDGGRLGLDIAYRAQDHPGGVAHGLGAAADLVAGGPVMLVLGDNIFYGSGLRSILRSVVAAREPATIFAYVVSEPSAYGTVVLDAAGRPVAIDEKPRHPRSRLAVPGLYVYGPEVWDVLSGITPSARGELEITDVNRVFLERGQLTVRPLGRGFAWLDGGTPEDLFHAAQFVKVLEDRTGLKLGCPEEVALRCGLIDRDGLRHALADLPSCTYRTYLEAVAAEDSHEARRTEEA